MMNKVCQIAVAAALAANVGVCAEATRPVPVTYIMVCCHEKDKGTKFLANGEWPERRDYRNYPVARDTMRKIKEAGVKDRRFAMACVNGSGCSGAKLNHIDLPHSEHVSQICRMFAFWFCNNYILHANMEDKWRVDQHEFIALMAPRLVCLGAASEDAWAGQLGEWWAAKLASPAWELYGKRGLAADEMDFADKHGWRK